ncbi:ATP-dependent DNA ligase [Tunturiibacter gelidoferens]|uniref:DNA ligase-1 n=1 Tax=Tunturiibacter gelidiferens TaxID=3069689 RepID=A0ACC5P1F6_9BACT|nr:ATP-dependent DNA ligase [Edaphobacter lichenicola]MBB5340565.1 DNA ligase-1 [Edaphobacter lichenicola]
MALFRAVAGLADQLAGEPGRLKKRAAISAAIAAAHQVAPESEDAGWFALYVAGTPFAEADSRKLNAGGALLSKALLAVSGASDQALTAAYRRHGDMGAAAYDLLVAAGAAGAAKTAELSLAEVAEAFAAMAVAKTTAIRAALVEGLLRRATPLEAKYLLKLMLGDMRIGVKQSLVEEAIAVAAGASVEAVRRAVMLEADLGSAVRRVFSGTLNEARMRLFHPLGFMLASPVETPEEAVERFTEKPAKVPVVKTKKPRKSKKAEDSLRRAMELDPDREAEVALAVEAEGDTPGEVVSPQKLDVDAEEFEDAPPEDVIAKSIPEEGDETAANAQQTQGIEAFLEDKYDGMRAQVHCGDASQPGRVAIYSRNKEDVTESFPELEEAFAQVCSEVSGATGSLILDGEILGWDFEQGRALPFAVLGQRIGRKRVSNEWRQQVPVVFMAFDLMCEDGELLLEFPLRERRNRLEAAVERLVERVVSPLIVDERARDSQAVLFAGEESAGMERLMISPSRLVESAEDIDRAYSDARARANEGVMLKAAGSVYQPGRRGLAWVKLKRELATLDVVVTGAEFGHGKRAGILSDYTFAVRGADGELLNVGKAYSGLTDVEIAEMSAWMMEHTLEDQGFFRTVEPLMVLEVAFNNIMRSGRHASGFALRFPRILKIRTDKPVSEIDTVARVEEVYQSQVDKPVE